MKFAYYTKKSYLKEDAKVLAFFERLRSVGHEIYDLSAGLQDSTDMLLSLGGDGTFLAAADYAAPADIPVLGINLGRLGFLSEYTLEEVTEPLLSGNYSLETREMLMVGIDGPVPEGFHGFALNEAGIHRAGAGTLGVDVSLGGEALPTYWADGLLVSTASGSTAYALSVGGPICAPSVDAFIIAPVAPHNLNVRPLVVPSDSVIKLSVHGARTRKVRLSLDNRDYLLDPDCRIIISPAPFLLKKVVLGKSNFINALRTKLFWGEDVRNNQ